LAISHRDARLHQLSQLSPGERKAHHLVHHDLLDEICQFVDEHSINRPWFFALIDKATPPTQKDFLEHQLWFDHSKAFKELLTNRLIALLENHPDLLDISVVSTLVSEEAVEQDWLDRRFDTLLELCLADGRQSKIRYLARQWPRLNDALKTHLSDWKDVTLPLREPNWRDPSLDYRLSPAYLFLMDQYEKALDSDEKAYQQLVKIAKQWRVNVPMRAVATRLIGKLRQQFNVFPVLTFLMRYGDVVWHYSRFGQSTGVIWDSERFDSPIRCEAGEGLLSFQTSVTWEVIVESYFINPRDDLLPFQQDWIAYLTDVLSGEAKEYTGIKYGDEERRIWYQALNDISEDELAKPLD
jgi:hypothetical protein